MAIYKKEPNSNTPTPMAKSTQNIIPLTQAQYDALTTEEKNNGTVYNIIDRSASTPRAVENIVGATATSQVVNLEGYRHYYLCIGITQSSIRIVRIYASTLLVKSARESVVCKYTTDAGVTITATYNTATNTLSSNVSTMEAIIIGVDRE